jgi:uncharacterized circularly permuted ATP-grasp superfamily protein/uncharacterized alpha-E superfamily protein
MPAGPVPAAVNGGALATYAPDPGRYDELLSPGGTVREHWRPLLAAAGRGATAEPAVLAGARDVVRRLVVENGVTYNVYADAQGAERPWELDPLPLVLTAEEWRALEPGIGQRVRLLELVLADLYGPQRLLAEGIVPPALAFGHPNFLWPCVDALPVGATWLSVCATDLARGPDGRWRVLADRTQTPSGAGYALESREIVEQVWPDAVRALGVRRLTAFFGELREQLLAGGDEGIAVVLTPGPLNETYFEHAYLARQLGFVLVEGADLTVRDHTVYLKTLGGLKRVRTILRRLDDDYADPLELRSDSALGVAGLLGAVRAGRVAVANALGSGVLESAAWLAYLPRAAERLLGEPLKLPSVGTWWCGERASLEYVLDNLERLVVKPTYPNQRFEPVFGERLDGPARDRLVARLRARPQAYVGQERLALGQVPVAQPGGGLAAKAYALRTFAIAGRAGRRVLPGGLARFAGEEAVDVVSAQRGGGSKDVWVLPERASPAPVAGAGPRPVVRREEEVPSRLLENLYWFGRYLVRAEDKARLLRAALAATVDDAVAGEALAHCVAAGAVPAGRGAAASVADERNPLGLVADLRRLARSATQVRGRLGAGAWAAIADLQRRLDARDARESPREALDRSLLSLAALTGLTLEDMRRDAGWRLLRVGRRLERLQSGGTRLAAHLASAAAAEPAVVEWLLDLSDARRAYLSRYVSAPRLGPLADLLVRDPEHPRSLACLARQVAADLARIGPGDGLDVAAAALAVAVDEAALAALEAEPAARTRLAGRLRDAVAGAGELSDRLSQRYFAHVGGEARVLAT